jgi:hypothetical protein
MIKDDFTDEIQAYDYLSGEIPIKYLDYSNYMLIFARVIRNNAKTLVIFL